MWEKGIRLSYRDTETLAPLSSVSYRETGILDSILDKSTSTDEINLLRWVQNFRHEKANQEDVLLSLAFRSPLALRIEPTPH